MWPNVLLSRLLCSFFFLFSNNQNECRLHIGHNVFHEAISVTPGQLVIGRSLEEYLDVMYVTYNNVCYRCTQFYILLCRKLADWADLGRFTHCTALLCSFTHSSGHSVLRVAHFPLGPEPCANQIGHWTSWHHMELRHVAPEERQQWEGGRNGWVFVEM